MMKRLTGIFLALVLLCGSLSFAEEAEVQRTEKYWRTVHIEDRGYDIIAMKKRLVELGYYKSTNFSDTYEKKIAPYVQWFQFFNDIMPTGILSLSDLALLHSEEAKPYEKSSASLPPPSERPVLEPSPATSGPMPERDTDGFLAEKGEYYAEDDEKGEWLYLTDRLQIIINRCEDPSVPLVWFETEILCKEGEHFSAVENNPEKPGRTFRRPADIAQTHQFVLGFTDDFYGHRVYRKELIGTVIRNGKILGDKTYKKDLHYLPNLDVLAEFADGSLKAYRSTEYTAKEFIDMGAVNVFCFGPVLLQNGVLDQRVLDRRFETKSPRQALGMIEPGHYFLLTVQGRIKESAGVGLIWMAEHMQKRGVTEALNLDGGNTVALIFRGRMLNQLATWKKSSFVRSVSSLIGLGYSDYVVE